MKERHYSMRPNIIAPQQSLPPHGVNLPEQRVEQNLSPEHGEDMVLLRHVSKRYATGHEALTDFSLKVRRAELVFITGHSGAGKSTLLKLIAMIERPSRGQIIVNGHNLNTLRRRRIPYFRRGIGIIFQDHHLLHDRTVFENVALPLIICGKRPREVGRRVRAALDKVGLLRREKSLPIALSGGEQQRVGIARAVATKPALLLADEPTGNLDPDLSREIMDLFLQFNQVGVTVLVASHDLGLIQQIDRRIVHLEQGRNAEGSDLPSAVAAEQ
jgi:cell division transport system ATP-binding protein